MVSNLVVVAHPDDEILGFGGTGCYLTSKGESVQPLIICGNVDARSQRPTDTQLLDDIHASSALVGFENPILLDYPNLRLNNVDHINIVQSIEHFIRLHSPSRIFTHHPRDLNQDHRIVSYACSVAARLNLRSSPPLPSPDLLYFETLSATDWSFPDSKFPFDPNLFVDITPFLDTKLKAISCYRNVLRPEPHSRSLTTIQSLASLRGSQSGFLYAEAFQAAFLTYL